MSLRWAVAFVAFLLTPLGAFADETPGRPATAVAVAGPVNAVFPSAGEAVRRSFPTPVAEGSPWTVRGWVRLDPVSADSRTVAAIVDKSGATLAEMGVANGSIYAAIGASRALSRLKGKSGDWLPVTLSSTGKDVVLNVGAERPVTVAAAFSGEPVGLVLAPRRAGSRPFTGAVAYLGVWAGPAPDVPALAKSAPTDELLEFESGSPTWPLQVKQFAGLLAPQNPATLPVSRSTDKAVPASARPAQTAPLTDAGPGRWTVGAWRFVAEPETTARAGDISRPGFDDSKWLRATVPGTILTSYIDNGVYADPAYGLNNLLIPEKLNRQDYWFRAEFELPQSGELDFRSLEFRGINYASEIWINGERVGSTAGAFIRGRFALPGERKPGERIAVAVRVSPAPHPSLPDEESLKGGPGQNGGAMGIDGPTFAASQGWDWIPSVRDRNTGIWQDVVLEAAGPVRLGDPHVRTVLPKPDNSVAELTIEVPAENRSNFPVEVTVGARFAAVALTQAVRLEPRSTAIVRFDPARFSELRIANPELWWPNGYGEAKLHDLALSANVDGTVSDTRAIRFGMREISYDLSLVDQREDLQRVTVAPSRGRGEKLLAVDHKNIRKVEGGWVHSLAARVGETPALAAAPETPLAPHLLLRVNGVPIPVRGGNWGMDDWLKRVSRERLEPYFRLHREANVNTIRNWLGQSTEEAFFDLADEYGLLVINDFWVSTQDHNAEPGDSALYLANAADTISNFRHHPSIALWIGRNEGVPPPVLNDGVEKLVRELDGTRAYLPNSRQISMAQSGPWLYQQPVTYFTRHAQGFSTEVGTPSFPTLASFKTMMPEVDRWPISDSWAYHDWHQGKAGDVAPFMRDVTARFGAATDLVDFEKKAQLLNYESHRAIFEGMNDGLFTRNSGRLLWMTHPAWPSTLWQIYGHDYDTHASYFGFRKGTEPVHVQLNLPDLKVAVVNSLGTAIRGAKVRIRNFSLDGGSLGEREIAVDAAAYASTTLEPAFAPALFDTAQVVLTKLELIAGDGTVLSDNFYWQARTPSDYRPIAKMGTANVALAVEPVANGDETEIRVTVTNTGAVPALMTKLSLLDRAGERVLPAYWSDNYLSLLAGEQRTVTIKSPKAGSQPHTITVEGWNVEAAASAVAQ